MCIRVDLPEPDGPMIAVNLPRSNPVLIATRASTAASPFAVAARDIARHDHLSVRAHGLNATDIRLRSAAWRWPTITTDF